MKNKHAAFSLFAVLFVFLNSCDIFTGANLIIKMDKAAFEKERAEWNSQNIKDYQFVYKFFNDAGPVGPVKITIKENEEPFIEFGNEFNQDVPFKSVSEIYDFLNGTFDFIESVRSGTYDGYKINSLELKITYDNQYHYPREVDFSEGYAGPIDGGGYYHLEIKDFAPLD